MRGMIAPNYVHTAVTGFEPMQGLLFVTVAYTPCNFEKFDDPVVPRVYFKPHQGNDVRFYSCSHSSPQMVAPVEITPGGESFKVYSCWSDIYDAITSAQKFVYLTGWSFHPLIPLIRDSSDPAKSRSLGELLKEASDRGCEARTSSSDADSCLALPYKACQPGRSIISAAENVKWSNSAQ